MDFQALQHSVFVVCIDKLLSSSDMPTTASTCSVCMLHCNLYARLVVWSHIFISRFCPRYWAKTTSSTLLLGEQQLHVNVRQKASRLRHFQIPITHAWVCYLFKEDTCVMLDECRQTFHRECLRKSLTNFKYCLICHRGDKYSTLTLYAVETVYEMLL